MATIDTDALGDRLRPRRQTLLWGALVLNTEVLLVLAYAAFGAQDLLSIGGLRLWIYPFVWINVALWAVVRTDPAAASTRNRRIAAALAVGYFGVLAYTGGLVGPGHGPTTYRVSWALPPGWSPAFLLNGGGLSLTLIPYKLIGYATLAYLVYATVLDAARSAVTGVLGLLSCVSCSWPVITSLATGLVGSGTGVAAAVSDGSYGISTVVFVVTVALLYWRPFGRDE
ncbi:DUF7546 family protein [Halosimplex amylolyticum]|uniref:DUF7546 family protein n=1 Tax=Halosimplex amylolyticum TaxID=3396616 RepID=UPI003F54BF00